VGMAGIDEEWIATGQERALEPELPICDPHHHLWDHPGSRYLLEELVADTADHNIVKTVFVECGSMYANDGPASLAPVGETAFVEGVAEKSAGGRHCAMRACSGIVGHADLLLGESVDAVLEAHLAASPDRFRGVRHSAAWHESDAIRPSHSKNVPHMLTLDRFREGFARLARYGLTFDAWLFHTQIDELGDLARAFEETAIVIDHVGGPLGIGPYAGKREEVFAAWSRSIAEIARCPNVVVKLGGIGMALNGFDWHRQPRPPSSAELAESQRPYLLHCIEHFGVERCMFESNFPVDKVSSSYTVLWNAFKRVAAGFSPEEKAALFHDNAVRAYRL
jgi:predicted TIM-barrel fold metal-dependent hydrolase